MRSCGSRPQVSRRPGNLLPSFSLRKFCSLEATPSRNFPRGLQQNRKASGEPCSCCWLLLSWLLVAEAPLLSDCNPLVTVTTQWLGQGFLAFPAETWLGLVCEHLREMACRKKVGLGTLAALPEFGSKLPGSAAYNCNCSSGGLNAFSLPAHLHFLCAHTCM